MAVTGTTKWFWCQILFSDMWSLASSFSHWMLHHRIKPRAIYQADIMQSAVCENWNILQTVRKSVRELKYNKHAHDRWTNLLDTEAFLHSLQDSLISASPYSYHTRANLWESYYFSPSHHKPDPLRREFYFHQWAMTFIVCLRRGHGSFLSSYDSHQWHGGLAQLRRSNRLLWRLREAKICPVSSSLIYSKKKAFSLSTHSYHHCKCH